ncbi:MAG: FHA domain-containing protein [Actinobacteria bacterium]|nr:FHA domain-containing protein [Actinomycetota bacterium]
MRNKGSIQALAGSMHPSTYNMEKDIVFVGRSSNSDIVINDKKASRNHARIIHNNGMYTIEDLNSRNGTRINGQKISGSRHLNPGNIVKIGNCEFSISANANVSGANSINKPLLVTLIMIFVVILGVTIPTLILTKEEPYKIVNNFEGNVSYSYLIPESYTSRFDYDDSVDYYYNNSKTKLVQLSVEYQLSDEKITKNELMSYAEDLYEGYEYYDDYTDEYFILEDKLDAWFYTSSSDKTNAYIVEFRATTSYPNVLDMFFWNDRNTLLYAVIMSISEEEEYLCLFLLSDTDLDHGKNIEIINTFIESINIIED